MASRTAPTPQTNSCVHCGSPSRQAHNRKLPLFSVSLAKLRGDLKRFSFDDCGGYRILSHLSIKMTPLSLRSTSVRLARRITYRESTGCIPFPYAADRGQSVPRALVAGPLAFTNGARATLRKPGRPREALRLAQSAADRGASGVAGRNQRDRAERRRNQSRAVGLIADSCPPGVVVAASYFVLPPVWIAASSHAFLMCSQRGGSLVFLLPNVLALERWGFKALLRIEIAEERGLVNVH